jgi:hypothetical protein
MSEPAGAIALSSKEQIQVELIKCFSSPLRFVLQFLPWGEPGPLENYKGPDKWQTKTLQKIEVLIRQGLPLGSPAIRLAISSGHGIGKTALVSWLILWFISTRPRPQIIVTANTQQQLTTKTWRELAKWKEMLLHGDWFLYTATQLKLFDRKETWFATAVPWSAANSSAFAGTHEEHVLIIFDEASEIADIIWETTEGAMTTPGAMWFAFGNPTSNTGRFRQCWTKFRKRWVRDKVDSRDAIMADKTQIQEWIDDYGIDSDFVKVRVLGEFPSAGSKQFIGSDIVQGAINRSHKDDPAYVNPRNVPRRIPKIMGIDIGSYGGARSIIVMRHGPHMLPKVFQLRDANHNVIAGYIGNAINEWEPDLVFIDATGYGHGVWLLLQQNGFDNVIPIYWGDRSMVMEPLTYYNPRIEIWHRMGKWLESGSIPDDNELFEDLIGPELHFDIGMRMRLESKQDMAKRGLPSPDKGDALALTFAHPVPVSLSQEYEDDMEPEVA